MEITYGIAVRSNDDAYVQMAEDATESVNKAAVAGAFYVEFLPFRRWRIICFAVQLMFECHFSEVCSTMGSRSWFSTKSK